MTGEQDSGPRRRRRRGGSEDDADAPAAGPVPCPGPPTHHPAPTTRAGDERSGDQSAQAQPARPVREPSRERGPVRSAGGGNRDPERGWRDLAGNSPSQVGVSGALRARDVARPEPADLARAERDVVIVRRQWVPPEDGR